MQLISRALISFLLAAGSDPLTDRMRYEIAAAQRDYLIAKQQLDAAAVRLKAKMEEAEKACSTLKSTFDPATFTCKEGQTQ